MPRKAAQGHSPDGDSSQCADSAAHVEHCGSCRTPGGRGHGAEAALRAGAEGQEDELLEAPLD